MTFSIVPALIDSVVAQARAALSVTVSDGHMTAEEPGDFLLVGVDDPDSPNAAGSASGTSDWATFRTPPHKHDEQGEIVCVAFSWSGNTDVSDEQPSAKAARDAATATIDALDAVMRADPTQALLPAGLLWARLGSSYDYSQDQDEDGAYCAITFRIAYRARI